MMLLVCVSVWMMCVKVLMLNIDVLLCRRTFCSPGYHASSVRGALTLLWLSILHFSIISAATHVLFEGQELISASSARK